MKRIIGTIATLFIGLMTVHAMSYEEACERARFLTDKMAYELNLNDAQYNDAYEINLDYLMNIRTEDDVTGIYWSHRNSDLRYILYDWQYDLFCAASYFFRPVVWRVNAWYFPVCDFYRPGHFFYNPPRVFTVYRGGHYGYRNIHQVSFYANRRPEWSSGFRGKTHTPIVNHPAAPRNNGNVNRPSTTQRELRNGTRSSNGYRIGNVNSNGSRTTSNTGTQRSTMTSRSTTTTQSPVRTQNATRSTTTQSSTQGRSGQTTRPASGQSTYGRSNSTTSSYNRPSSTRTTVNRTTSGGSTTTRTQSASRTPSRSSSASRSSSSAKSRTSASSASRSSSRNSRK